MTGPLMVLVSHGLDFLTFLMAVSLFGLPGEVNGLAKWLVALGGFGLLLLVKSAGATLLAGIVQRRPGYLLPAAGAGLLGASLNLLAMRVF